MAGVPPAVSGKMVFSGGIYGATTTFPAPAIGAFSNIPAAVLL
jgi:hypothetical protein